MRIAFLLPVFPLRSNTFVTAQITGLIDRGHEVDLYPLETRSFAVLDEDLREYGLEERIRHVHVPRPRLRRATAALRHLLDPCVWRVSTLRALDPRLGRAATSLVHLFTTISFLRQSPYDVLHCQFANLAPNALALLAAGATRARLVTSFRGADTSSHLRESPRMYDRLFQRGDLFLPVCHAFRERLVAAGAPPERTRVHHSGIDVQRFTFQPRTKAPDEPTRLLFVGRVTEKKGVLDTLGAFAKLAAEGRSVALTIVGSGELDAEVARRVQGSGFSHKIRLLGDVSHTRVVATMRASHVLVAPSATAANGDQEGIPNVLKEAMATGMPVVSTRHSGIPELVEDGVSGYLVEEHDRDALADRLSRLIDTPERWATFGRAGRAKVAREFDIETLNDELVALYADTVEAPPVRDRARAAA